MSRCISFFSAVAIITIAVSTGGAEEQKIEVAFDSPATNYRVKIQEVYRVGDEMWVVSKISTKGDIGGAAITRISDEITIDAEDLPVIHKVLGKTWNWGKDTKTLQYVSADDLKEQLKKQMAESIWKRTKPKEK